MNHRFPPSWTSNSIVSSPLMLQWLVMGRLGSRSQRLHRLIACYASQCAMHTASTSPHHTGYHWFDNKPFQQRFSQSPLTARCYCLWFGLRKLVCSTSTANLDRCMAHLLQDIRFHDSYIAMCRLLIRIISNVTLHLTNCDRNLGSVFTIVALHSKMVEGGGVGCQIKSQIAWLQSSKIVLLYWDFTAPIWPMCGLTHFLPNKLDIDPKSV